MAVSKLIPSEDHEQAKLVVWMTKQNIKFYAIPNGGKRGMMEAIKFKRTGVQSGVPDICIPIPSGGYHGCYIEMKKSKGGKLGDNQAYWLEFLTNHGYYACVAHGFDEAKEIVTHYLSLTKPAA
jgi:VRR-NUC domain